MGWASGTELFDKVIDAVLSELGPNIRTSRYPEDMDNCIESIITAFEDADWDTQSESEYYDHPMVQRVFRVLHPDWFE